MKRMKSGIALLLLGAVSATGCSSMNHTERGAALGAGLGGVLGAVIGHQTGNRDTGALVGAGIGGLTGAVMGKAEDNREEQETAIAQAQYAEQSRQHALRAVTNDELITMSQNGLSSQIIINAIKNRGGQFDLSPNGLIQLQRQGVSNELIEYAQKNGRAASAPQPVSYRAAPVVRTSTVYVAPVISRPVIIHQCQPPRPRLYIHGHFGKRRRH